MSEVLLKIHRPTLFYLLSLFYVRTHFLRSQIFFGPGTHLERHSEQDRKKIASLIQMFRNLVIVEAMMTEEQGTRKMGTFFFLEIETIRPLPQINEKSPDVQLGEDLLWSIL